jgi:hypothetical protein
MARSSLTYIPGFSVKFFFQPIYTDYANIQGPFHQSLVQIGPVASEELIKMWKVNGRTDGRTDGRRTTDDGRSVVTIAHPLGQVSVIPTSNQDGRQAKNRKKGG